MPSGVRPDREVAAARAGGGFSRGGNSGGGMSSADQRHRNRAAEISRVGAATGRSTRPSGNTGVSPAGRVSSTALGMSRDYRNVGNSFGENVGNRLAGLFGFNEQPPSLSAAAKRVDQTAPGMVTDKRAGWGFDPAPALGMALGGAFGVPLVGTVTDYLSKMAGRPLEMSMGPSVFGGGPSYGGTAPGMGPSMANRFGNTGARDFGAAAMAARPSPPMAPTTRPAAPPAPPRPMSWSSGAQLSSGLPGYGTFRPGYSFVGPGGAFR